MYMAWTVHKVLKGLLVRYRVRYSYIEHVKCGHVRLYSKVIMIIW